MDQLWHYETFIKHLIFAVRQKNHKRSICALGKVRRKARQSANYGGMLESLKFDIMKQIIVRTFQQPDIIVDNESRIRLILEFYILVAILITADIPHCAQSAMIGLLYYYHDPWSASSIPFSCPALSHGCILLFFAIL